MVRRATYPLSFEEERLLFSELADHLAGMALFKVDTGTRKHEVLASAGLGGEGASARDIGVRRTRKSPAVAIVRTRGFASA